MPKPPTSSPPTTSPRHRRKSSSSAAGKSLSQQSNNSNITSNHRNKQQGGWRMSFGLKNLVSGAKKLALGGGGGSSTEAADLFPATTPERDGDDCTHDCESCHAAYPRGFKIDEDDALYGQIKGFSTHVLVATGKTDWVRDVEDEKGSVMAAFGKAEKPGNGRLMLSASNMPTPSHTTDYSEPTTLLLLPAFTLLENVTPAAVPKLISHYIEPAPTTHDPLAPVSLPRSLPLPDLPSAPEVLARPSPHRALVLLCSQKTRDARCGQSAPILRKELERHLRPLGLHRDPDDERPGGVGVYFISHVGGHKYSANMMVYRRPDAFGVDAVERGKLPPGEEVKVQKTVQKKVETPVVNESEEATNGAEGVEKVGEEDGEDEDVGAGQCIWLARVRPEDCENIVKYTVLQGKVVKPGSQLRGGFDRGKGVMSW
ncbi:Sucrase/ferredoxin-like-domain-containing protein [Xylariaceae sp. FL0016]|nr:Sucrase/ferredoxin-like-domain-containing protein [Xylariaceae sp. FL0016]